MCGRSERRPRQSPRVSQKEVDQWIVRCFERSSRATAMTGRSTSTLLRNRRQAEHLPRPAWPATGTTLIAARLAKLDGDLALVRRSPKGRCCSSNRTPGDNALSAASLRCQTTSEPNIDDPVSA